MKSHKHRVSRMSPSGLDRLLSIDISVIQDKAVLHKHRQALLVYKFAFEQDTLPMSFYRIVGSHAASGFVPRNAWWRSNLDFAFETADSALLALSAKVVG